MDWNQVVRLLDELSDGVQPAAVVRHTMARYEPASLARNLFFLADRDLIQLRDRPDSPNPIAKSEWQDRIRIAFEVNRPSGAQLWIDLTPDGEQILRLFGIRHP